MKIVFSLLALVLTSWAHAAPPTPVLGWNVDCNNHCTFNEFPHNCQGVYYYYADGTYSYSGWSSNYNACEEVAPSQLNMHIIAQNLIQCGCPTNTVTLPSETAALTNTTRAQLQVLRASIQSWAVCTPDPGGSFSNLWEPLTYQNLNTCQYFRKHGLAHNYYTEAYKGLEGLYEDGWHKGLFAGDQISNTLENCLFGDKEQCDGIKDSQDPVTGQWFRTPFDRRHSETSYGQSLSSRDVLMGIIGYVVATNDKEALRKFLIAVNGNPKHTGFFNLCPARPNISKPDQMSQKDWDAMLPDDRCNLIPESAGQIYNAAITVGLTNADLYAISPSLYSALAGGSTIVYPTIASEAATVPANGGPGYQIGDTADGIFNAMATGGAGNATLLGAANTIDTRTGKLHPGYHFLAQNRTATEYGAYLINKYCKPTRPQWGEQYASGYSGHGTNWDSYWNTGSPIHTMSYQFTGGWGPYGSKMVPTGHDCISWLDMYIGNGNVEELKCDAGDTLINGACEKFAFTPPPLAAIYGIDYKLKIGNSVAKIHYMAVDLNQCPYGGTLEIIDGVPRCSFSSDLISNSFNWTVNYTVDPTESAPGIYYNKVNNACPYGGTYSGSRCLVQNYASPILHQSVRYWVDTNPSWPGVYYAKINGACPYGGVPTGGNCEVQGFASGVLSTSRNYFTRANPAHPGVYYYPSTVVPETKLPVPVHASGTVEMQNHVINAQEGVHAVPASSPLLNTPQGGR